MCLPHNCVSNPSFVETKITCFLIYRKFVFIYFARKNSFHAVLIEHIVFKTYFYKTTANSIFFKM